MINNELLNEALVIKDISIVELLSQKVKLEDMLSENNRILDEIKFFYEKSLATGRNTHDELLKVKNKHKTYKRKMKNKIRDLKLKQAEEINEIKAKTYDILTEHLKATQNIVQFSDAVKNIS